MEAEPTLPAACAECIETTVPAIPGAAVASSIMRRYRAADGRLRVDFENFSMIVDPATGERIMLDHLAQEARVLAGRKMLRRLRRAIGRFLAEGGTEVN